MWRAPSSALEVHRHLRPGYLESIYERALAVEFARQQIPFERQVSIEVTYEHVLVGEHRLDLVAGHAVVIELKAVEILSTAHLAQVLSYLRATNYELGLLINFNAPVLKDGIRRVVRSVRST